MAECGCGDPKCPCRAGESEPMYWCEMCREAFPDKRCPKCGLKLKKMR